MHSARPATDITLRPRWRRTALACLAAMAAALVVGSAGAGVAKADEPPVERMVGGAGPLGAVTAIGDSVLYGSKDSLPEALVAEGFGPVRYRATLGMSAGNHIPINHVANAAGWITRWRAEGWNPSTLLVNLGANDVGFCDDTAGCEKAVRFLMERIGTGPTVLWPLISHHYPEDSEMWNAALMRVAADYPNLVLWDWPTARVENGIPIAWDNIHLPNTAAYAKRSTLLAAALLDAVSGSQPSGIAAPTPTAAGDASTYQPLAPERVLDTRSSGRLGAGQQLSVDLAGMVPAGATAAAVNVTAVDAVADGYLTVWPCDVGRPEVSSVNYTTRGARGAHAVVPLSGSRLCVFSPVAVNVIVDLQGAFVPGDGGQRYAALSEPQRLLDTRGGAAPALVQVRVPDHSTAVTVNLTATSPTGTGYLTAYPCGGAAPGVSNVNFTAGETVAGSAYVPVSAEGTICIAAVGGPQILVDLTGTFGIGGTLAFTPAVPTRVLDTRSGVGGWVGRLKGGQRITLPVVPAGASAVTGTVTAVGASADGFVSAAATLTASPSTSNLNVARGGTIANSVTTGVRPDGSLQVFSSTIADVLVDVTGWWS